MRGGRVPVVNMGSKPESIMSRMSSVRPETSGASGMMEDHGLRTRLTNENAGWSGEEETLAVRATTSPITRRSVASIIGLVS